MKPDISVIVPVYNAQTTLSRCLDSILSQSFENFEVIVINDGSTDCSDQIIQRYAIKDTRIRVINQNNSGIAYTRQHGIEESRGEWIANVDADDWIEHNMLQKMLSTAHQSQADIVFCDFFIHEQHHNYINIQNPESSYGTEVLPRMIRKLHGSLCNKLIRQAKLQEYNISFEPGLDCNEDQLVVLKLLSCGVRIGYINQPLYHYNKTGGDNSITGRWYDFPMEKRLQFIKIASLLSTNSDYQKELTEYIASIAYDALFCSYNACPNYARLFKPYKSIIRSSGLHRLKKMIVLLRLVGVKIPVNHIRYIREKIL